MGFDTSRLDRALEERRAEWERRRIAMLEKVIAALDEVAPIYGVEEAYIFGSLAQPGRYHQGSDIDIAVRWGDRKDFFGLAGDVSRRLGQDIDILPLEKIHFAEKIARERELNGPTPLSDDLKRNRKAGCRSRTGAPNPP